MMFSVKKLLEMAIFLALFLGIPAVAMRLAYGNLAWIPQEDLVAYSFWLLLACLGLLVLSSISLFIGGKSRKKAQEPPVKIHSARAKKKGSSVLSLSEKDHVDKKLGAPKKNSDEAPAEWEEEEFE